MDTKTKIIKNSLELFAQKGYEGTSMSDIATAVGIRKASIYSHYKGKEEIFQAVFSSIVEEHSNFLNEFFETLNGLSAEKKLETIFRGYISYCKDNRNIDFWNRFYYFPPESLRTLIHDTTHETEAVMESEINTSIKEGMDKGYIKEGGVKEIGIAFYYMMIGFMLSLSFYEDKDMEKDLTACFNTFWDGIRNNPD